MCGLPCVPQPVTQHWLPSQILVLAAALALLELAGGKVTDGFVNSKVDRRPKPSLLIPWDSRSCNKECWFCKKEFWFLSCYL